MRDIDGRAQQVANPGAPIIAAAPTLRRHHAEVGELAGSHGPTWLWQMCSLLQMANVLQLCDPLGCLALRCMRWGLGWLARCWFDGRCWLAHPHDVRSVAGSLARSLTYIFNYRE